MTQSRLSKILSVEEVVALNSLDANRSQLILRSFRRLPDRQVVCLAAILTLASCEQSEKHETPVSTADDEAILSYESLSEFIGKEWTLDPEVVDTLLTHPGFRDAPPVTAKFGESRGESTDEYSVETVAFVHLGQGWIEAKSNYQAQGGYWTDYQSTGRTISLLAGLLPFATWNESTSTWEDDAPQTDLGGARIIAINSISGQIFPMEVGQSMTVELVRASWDFNRPEKQSTSWEVPMKTTIMWEVTRIVDGSTVGFSSFESVFEIINTITTIDDHSQNIHSSENKFYYIPSLGIALRSGQYSSEYPDIRKRWSILE